MKKQKHLFVVAIIMVIAILSSCNQTEMITCNACGATIPSDAIFCSQCGANLASETTLAPENSVAPETTITPETTVTSENTIAPETTSAPETTVIPETTAAPEVTTSLPHVHSYGAWAEHQNPTCTVSGEMIRTCYCGEKETLYVAAKGHTEVIDPAVAPTCTVSGLTEGKHCSVCGMTIVNQNTVAALDHNEVIDPAVTATCTQSGLTEGKHCSICGLIVIKQTTIASKGHIETTVSGYAATCTQSGLTDGKKCVVCQTDVIPQTIIPSKEHDFRNGLYCDICGTVKPSDGLQYELSDDGKFYILTNGSGCRDFEIIVPSTYNNLPVTRIGSEAFKFCDMTSIILPDSIESIGWQAFSGCTSLKNITIPNSVVEIDSYAFERCYSLESVTIGSSVEHINLGAFGWCDSLKTITVDKNNKKYHSSGNCIIETATKRLVVGCNNSVIPSDGSVTIIGESAFNWCEKLKNISIPDTITNIEMAAFDGCTALKSVILPESVVYVDLFAFEACESLQSIYIYNSNCIVEMDWDCNTLGYPEKTTIYGYDGSLAQGCTKKYGYSFVVIS